MKKIITLVAVVVVALGLFLTVFVFDPFKLNLNFLGRELTIDKTANVISEIKKISEFTTACFFEDKIIDEPKYKYFDRRVYPNNNSKSTIDRIVDSAGKLLSLSSDYETVRDSSRIGRIVYTVTTKVRAGFDLSKIEEGDLRVSGDTLCVKLPPVEIFDIIANPSDWKIFHREGEWADDEIRAIQSKAKDAIREDAISFGLMEKAETGGKSELVALFKTFGFSNVVVE